MSITTITKRFFINLFSVSFLLSLGICTASSAEDLFLIAQKKLGNDPCFLAGLDEAQKLVEVVKTNPNRDEPHPILTDVLELVTSVVKDKTGNTVKPQPIPTWDTVIPQLLDVVKLLPSTFEDLIDTNPDLSDNYS